MMHARRRPPWPAGWALAALALAASAVMACGGSEEGPDSTQQQQRAGGGTRGLGAVRGLPGGDEAFVQRPRSCSAMHGVVIDSGGNPRPRVLNVRSGACVIWGNRTDRDAFVHTVQVHPEGTETNHSNHVPAGSAHGVYGPLERLTPARAALDEQRRAERRFCPYSAIGLGDPSTDTPVKHRYTISPGGAQGTIVVAAPSRSPATRPQARSAELRRLLRLRCGAVLLEERHVYCNQTRVILITGGKPRPRRLGLRSGRSVCVFWANEDDRATRVVAKPDPRPPRGRGARPFRTRVTCREGFDIVDKGGRLETRPRGERRCARDARADALRDPGRSIPPRTAAELSSFRFSRGATPRGRLSYEIGPSGATATVAFE